MLLSRSALALRLLGEQCGDNEQVVYEHGGPYEQLEVLAAFPERALHSAASEENRDAAFNPGPEPLAFLELRALLEGLSFGAPLATGLRDARELHTGLLACLDGLLTGEAAIATVELGCPLKCLFVTLQ